MLYQFNHFGLSEYFCKEYGENFNFPMHLHHSFELITVLEGEMTVTVDQTVYALQKGQSVLVFPDQLHALQSRCSKHMLVIFSAELVKAYYTKIQAKVPLNNAFRLSDFAIQALDNILPTDSVVEKKGILYSLCAKFDKTAAYTARTRFYDALLYKIFEFVEQNFMRDCSLSSLAENLGYSYAYLSRCFKKSTGISFNAYVNQYRISNACYLLKNTDSSVLQCALESGYTSLRSFNRQFSALLHATPTVYRNT